MPELTEPDHLPAIAPNRRGRKPFTLPLDIALKHIKKMAWRRRSSISRLSKVLSGKIAPGWQHKNPTTLENRINRLRDEERNLGICKTILENLKNNP
jgi:hypothetical protein